MATGISFIGAQGFGAGANGWREATAQILFVTNLNNSGAGSLRAAAATSGAKYIIFRIGGYVDFSSDLPCNSNTYIAGQSAPGDGVCARLAAGATKFELLAGTSHICIRHIAIRSQASAGANVNCLAIFSDQTIVDHCSFTWAEDDNVFYDEQGGALNITIQYCITAEGLRGKAILKNGLGSGNASIHHNYMAHCTSRFPSVHSGHNEIISNLSYNYGSTTAGWGGQADLGDFHTSQPSQFNWINNFFRFGPTSGQAGAPFASCFELLSSGETGTPAGIYLTGNKVQDGTASSITARISESGSRPGLPQQGSPYSFSPVVAVTQDSADSLAGLLLSSVGATKPARSAIDQAIVDSYAALTGDTMITSETQSRYGSFPSMPAGTATHLEPSGMTQEFITRMGLANTTASALSTSISTARGLGEPYQNLEWNLMEKAGDISPLVGSATSAKWGAAARRRKD
ncbi:pectate lyase [Caudoviricetes sp.]|nr:pectate lyase [Caudoviricetes sp.]UOF79637.1 pectate lyase [Caudoviricetes sp.]UOF79829.1 pectate lyase [Bacteriophage sp.]UOF81308.1 pectate lyase [Caudoviricetes sp.]